MPPRSIRGGVFFWEEAMKIIGLTGSIASGKSTVAKMFAAEGAIVRSADEDARAVLAPESPLLAEVFAAFPDVQNNDGTLNRAALAAQIFADESARERLEALTHPAIIARMDAAIADARADTASGILVYETPLLYEASLEALFDTVVVVYCAPDVQAERLQAREAAANRPPLTPEQIAQRLAAQLPADEKARRADFVIRTDVPIKKTQAAIQDLWQRLNAKR
jgi:dephospho-CoA kinase